MSKHLNVFGRQTTASRSYSVTPVRQAGILSPTPQQGGVKAWYDSWRANQEVERRKIQLQTSGRIYVLERRMEVAVAEESGRIVNQAAVNIGRMSRQALEETGASIQAHHQEARERIRRGHVVIDSEQRELAMEVARGELSQASADMQNRLLDWHREVEFEVGRRLADSAAHQMTLLAQGCVGAVRAVMPDLTAADEGGMPDQAEI